MQVRIRSWFSTARLRLQHWPAGCVLTTLVLACVIALLRPLRLDLGLTNVALLLLILSVLSAAVWGWVVGIYTSILANLSFNFFFVPPLGRFSVAQPDNALALALFLLVASITAGLLGQWRRSALEAERRASDTRTLLALSRTTRDRPLPEMPLAICEWIVRDFAVRSCAIYRLDADELELIAAAGSEALELSRAERSVALQAARSGRPAALGYRRRSRIIRRPGIPSESGLLYLPLRLESQTLGVLRLQAAGAPLTDDQERLLDAFADEAAASLQRASLAATAQTATMLQETDRLKSSLLSSVSHDLRTPLTSIKASVANLMSTEVHWSEAARQEFLAAIDREADRLTRLVTNLLDLSRIEAGVLRLDTDWNDLEDLLRNAIDRTEQAAPDRSVRLELEAALPLLRFDYVQIDRVISNLLDNTLKYSPTASPIAVRVALETDQILVEVRDGGSGIPPSERLRIFDPFYRSERIGKPAGGSGLGLAICRGIVEAHGGRIWADSDGGARMRFTLPCQHPLALGPEAGLPESLVSARAHGDEAGTA